MNSSQGEARLPNSRKLIVNQMSCKTKSKRNSCDDISAALMADG